MTYPATPACSTERSRNSQSRHLRNFAVADGEVKRPNMRNRSNLEGMLKEEVPGDHCSATRKAKGRMPVGQQASTGGHMKCMA